MKGFLIANEMSFNEASKNCSIDEYVEVDNTLAIS